MNQLNLNIKSKFEMTKKFIFSILTFLATYLYAQNEVKISNQIWMTANLNVSVFRNGDSIFHAKSNKEWENAGNEGKPAWCYYENNAGNESKYGKLYNWYAVTDPRGLAPKGWHIPSETDWKTFEYNIGGNGGDKLKSTSDWKENTKSSDNNTASSYGNNFMGFNGYPSGIRYYDGFFIYKTQNGYWWSKTEMDTNLAWFYYLDYRSSELLKNFSKKSNGLSVRCIKD